MEDIGKIGEKIISGFVDNNFTNLLSFKNPQNRKNQEICDLLIWLNYTVILCEIKTREDGIATHSWVKSKIEESVDQLTKSFDKINNYDIINLKNSKFHAQLDCKNVKNIIGLVILVHDNDVNYYPTDFDEDVYNKDYPIHFFSWNSFSKLSFELKTIQDMMYYLKDRYEYLKKFDIAFQYELELLGYYKSNNYKFPSKKIESTEFWKKYIESYRDKIYNREQKTQYSLWIDNIEKYLVKNKINKERKLFDNIPIGMYVAFELASLDFAFRAEIGQKIAQVKDCLKSGKKTRKFGYENPLTKNWIIFYFSTEDVKVLNEEFNKLTRLKYIQLKSDVDFSLGIYSFSFHVNLKENIISMQNIILHGDNDLGVITSEEIEEAKSICGRKKLAVLSEY